MQRNCHYILNFSWINFVWHATLYGTCCCYRNHHVLRGVFNQILNYLFSMKTLGFSLAMTLTFSHHFVIIWLILTTLICPLFYYFCLSLGCFVTSWSRGHEAKIAKGGSLQCAVLIAVVVAKWRSFLGLLQANEKRPCGQKRNSTNECKLTILWYNQPPRPLQTS